MGEFKMPFNALVTKNIKHIYSGFPQVLSMRHSRPYPTMEQLKLREDNQDLKTGVLRFSEYDETHGCYIPRAPAFRAVSRHEMDDMVERLQKPTVASRGISNTSDKVMVTDLDKLNPRYRGVKKIDPSEIPIITERLQKPTKISAIRKHQTATKLTEVSI